VHIKLYIKAVEGKSETWNMRLFVRKTLTQKTI
jgi:hypothetical protein